HKYLLQIGHPTKCGSLSSSLNTKIPKMVFPPQSSNVSSPPNPKSVQSRSLSPLSLKTRFPKNLSRKNPALLLSKNLYLKLPSKNLPSKKPLPSPPET
nr:hypothetical ORF-2 protein - Leishmania tarentolae mitochondrion [Leishmania tarentolae]